MTVSILIFLSMGKNGTGRLDREPDDLQFLRTVFAVDAVITITAGSIVVMPYFFWENVTGQLTVDGCLHCLHHSSNLGSRTGIGWLCSVSMPAPTNSLAAKATRRLQPQLLAMRSSNRKILVSQLQTREMRGRGEFTSLLSVCSRVRNHDCSTVSNGRVGSFLVLFRTGLTEDQAHQLNDCNQFTNLGACQRCCLLYAGHLDGCLAQSRYHKLFHL